MTETAAAVPTAFGLQPSETLLLLGPSIVDSIFDLDLAFSSQERAFEKLARGESWQPDKIGGGHPHEDSTLFCYAARLDRETGPASKFGSVNPANAAYGLPSIHAIVTLLHPTTGVPLAIIDGTRITAKRTAAASALAARELALPGAHHVGVLGAGQQAVSHIRALHAALPSSNFQIWAPRSEQRDLAVQTLCSEGIVVVPAPTIRDALHRAHIVVTATRSINPLFAAADLSEGTLIISVGSFEAHRAEIGLDTLQISSDIVVDDKATAEAHSGPVVQLRSSGHNTPLTELGSVLTQTACIRSSDPSGIVTYLSVGLGVQDAAAAWCIYEKARFRGLGTTVPW